MTGGFLYCDCITSGNSACLSTAAAMLSLSHEITLKTITTLYFFYAERLWRVCTFAQAHMSLRPGTEISCADSNNDLCTVYKNSECCCEAAPITTGILCNHQCVVSMRQKMLPVRCNKNSSIKHLLVYQEKKPKEVIVFWMLFHGNMTTTALRRADFTQLWQLH